MKTVLMSFIMLSNGEHHGCDVLTIVV
jgi:hypothetical protein